MYESVKRIDLIYFSLKAGSTPTAAVLITNLCILVLTFYFYLANQTA